MLTRADHQSGTDRVAEVAARPEFTKFEYVVNLQGDEPFLPSGAADAAVALAQQGWDVGSAAVAVSGVDEWRDPATVKVVRDDRGGALYFSRAPIPFNRDAVAGAGLAPLLRHIGVYAFRQSTLARAAALPGHPLEAREGLEQLRWLAAGLRIGVALVEGGGPGVDSEDDLVRAEAILRERESRND